MRRGARIRGAVALAVGINLALSLARPVPAFTLLHPVAPPLTHIPEMGERTLQPQEEPPAPPAAGGERQAGPRGGGLRWALDRVVRAQGTPEQRAALGALGGTEAAIPALAARALTLRIAVEADAAAVAGAVGAERLEAFLGAREALSASMGEARVWADARDRVRR